MEGGHERPPPSAAERLAQTLTPRQLLEAAGAALDPGPGEWMLSVAYNEQTKVRFIRIESRYTDGRLDEALAD